MKNNPIIWSDFPDPDVIRVDDTYYMVSTTMHFMPGVVILRSYDLVNWEIASYVCDIIEDTPGQRLEGELNIYGKGMWAATIRHHKGIFYVCFVSNDTGKTYLCKAKNINGPWDRQYVEGFYHDCSLLFDDDDRIYIVYGNSQIHLVELKPDLTGPKTDGLNRIIITDKANAGLGYEGAHIYKINGKYYVFLIHWPNYGNRRRVEACYYSESLEGEFVGKDVLDDDMGYFNAGVAQGGIVDTPEGEWYAMLFQDHGAIGRIPVLVPVHWENDFPVFGVEGKVPHHIEVKSTRPEYRYEPLVESDEFIYTPDENGKVQLKKMWQWNHIPDNNLWSISEKQSLRIRSGKISTNIMQAVNTLTVRMTGPVCETTVTIDGSELKDGDYAGISAFQGIYGLIALTKQEGQYYLVMLGNEISKDTSIWGEPGGDKSPGKEYARVPVESHKVTFKMKANFENNRDEVEFYYESKEEWMKLGITQKLYFRLDHFVGCRVGLFLFSTKEIGGIVDFEHFVYN